MRFFGVELDELAPEHVDVRELYDIAAEVGISPTSLEQAIREARQKEDRRERTTRRARTFRRVVTGIGAAVVGAMTKFLTFIMSAPFLFPAIAIAPLTAIALVLAVYSRSRGGHKTFRRDNAILWIGFGIGFVWIGLRGPADLIPPIIGWGVTAILGFFVTRKAGAEPPDSPEIDASLDRLIAPPEDVPPDAGDFMQYVNIVHD